MDVYIPLRAGTKKPPLVKGWADVPPPAMHIEPDQNVALRLDNAIDIDCDCEEARKAAPVFLKTDRTHGRPSVGVTHFWFGKVEGAKYECFTDVVKEIDEDGKEKYQTLIEIRTDHGHYTLIPNSSVPVKGSGNGNGALETLRWFAEGDPRTCPFDQLRTDVMCTAITALIARHCVPDGERWRFYEALAGFLLGNVKLPADKVTDILGTVADIINDTDTSPRPDEWVKRTVARLAKGQECTGAPTVATMIGEHGSAVVKAIQKWCGIRDAPADFPLTEAGDAEAFADLYQDHVRFDHRRGRWLVSDETSGIWVPDPVERLTQMTVEMMRARQRQSLTLKDDEKKKAIAWTIKGESRTRLNNAIALARSVPPIADPGEHWDEDPFLLGVQNGVVDLRTGHFRKAIPADRVTMRVRTAYDPNATCPLWLQTLADIFAPQDLLTAENSREVIAFMQRALGYSITADCREECCFFTWGDGCNGKGTVMNTLGCSSATTPTTCPTPRWNDQNAAAGFPTTSRSSRGSGLSRARR